ncbi:hypothetical protein F3Y22_tig00111582pilonHSYRG00512 [Hibiscus syriacus]|uniref:Endonuclease/exonuclease/phosphatase domain-containing protein n=1 Tax=Hibiscus syriacus TaxID=106335 RepID=A0A6A2XME3_HIBSY|nr:hypothetical protein F3Y22_tig00111582pilonHSYRG00512 [Hibiscus syriacus]
MSVEAQDFSGGIWLMWDSSIQIHLFQITNQFIHGKSRFKIDSLWHFFTTVYASLNVTIRRNLWNMISNLNPSNNEPWIIGGDFNCILKMEDRHRGSANNEGFSGNFNKFVFYNGLMDINSLGRHYTWSRGNLWQRLDRCLTNVRLNNLYPHSTIHHLERVGSDHYSLLLQLNNDLHIERDREFRFLTA